MSRIMSILIFWAGTLVLLNGCASSDRMIRMSGGVVDNYSIPSSYRIRSEKYQKL